MILLVELYSNVILPCTLSVIKISNIYVGVLSLKQTFQFLQENRASFILTHSVALNTLYTTPIQWGAYPNYLCLCWAICVNLLYNGWCMYRPFPTITTPPVWFCMSGCCKWSINPPFLYLEHDFQCLIYLMTWVKFLAILIWTFYPWCCSWNIRSWSLA